MGRRQLGLYLEIQELAALCHRGLNIHRALHFGYRPRDALHQVGNLHQVFTVDLDRNISRASRKHLRNPHLDRLRETHIHAGEALQHLAHLPLQLGLAGKTPLVWWQQLHENIRLVEPHRVQPQLVGACARNNLANFGHAGQERGAHLAIKLDRGGQGNAGGFFQLHDQVTFIKHRHERLAHQQQEDRTHRQQCPDAE